jgi:hypothetical protein
MEEQSFPARDEIDVGDGDCTNVIVKSNGKLSCEGSFKSKKR